MLDAYAEGTMTTEEIQAWLPRHCSVRLSADGGSHFLPVRCSAHEYLRIAPDRLPLSSPESSVHERRDIVAQAARLFQVHPATVNCLILQLCAAEDTSDLASLGWTAIALGFLSETQAWRIESVREPRTSRVTALAIIYSRPLSRMRDTLTYSSN
ncbi:hypothetical protein HNQ08_004896 [Deinococcus humi]|uniref:Uncharacterized protein n=1 Tax=Deinococcus humi TaxID=662880 RepID=A0A7W8JZC9_9DEIO|nr:hypothetical protein [Deinococcus humi]